MINMKKSVHNFNKINEYNAQKDIMTTMIASTAYFPHSIINNMITTQKGHRQQVLIHVGSFLFQFTQ